jgi:hypothetical protein
LSTIQIVRLSEPTTEVQPKRRPALLRLDDFPVFHGCQLIRNQRASHLLAYADHRPTRPDESNGIQ